MTGGHRLYSTRDSSFWCCVGSGFECHSRYQSSIFFHNDSELYVNLFIPSELAWDDTRVRLSTLFPADGLVTLSVSGKARRFTMKLRRPWWATSMKVNGRKAKVDANGYASITRTWREGDRLTVEYGMALHEEPTKDDPTRVALMYGPIVLGARLATVEHPFSDPNKYNDYYTFDYGSHPDITYRSLDDFRQISPLHYEGPDGTKVEPLYDLHHCRYGVYWKK